MIREFKDEYSWLSNMTPFEKPFIYQGISYRTNEHFYVAMKTTDKEKRFILSFIQSPGKVKREGRNLDIRDDWDDIKIDVMRTGLKYKFSKDNPILRQKLIETGDVYIQEGNTWGDQFWGFDLINDVGFNYLGKMIMEIRSKLTEEK